MVMNPSAKMVFFSSSNNLSMSNIAQSKAVRQIGIYQIEAVIK
jgi:hypothetical protein